MPAEPPKLPPIVKGARDEFSGARDILRAMGLKPAHDHFLAAGRPPAALNCDTELPGISAGFELRQGRAMELAPLLEAPPPAAAKALEVLDRDRARAAFSFKPTPFSLREEDLGTVPAVIRRAKDEAAAFERELAAAREMATREGVVGGAFRDRLDALANAAAAAETRAAAAEAARRDDAEKRDAETAAIEQRVRRAMQAKDDTIAALTRRLDEMRGLLEAEEEHAAARG